MTSETWLHDLLLFATALLAAYAAYRGRENGKTIDTVARQTNGLVERVVQAETSVARVEGIREGVALVKSAAPPANGGQLPPGGSVSPPPI